MADETKRPELLAQWSRAAVPADLAATTPARRQRFERAIVEAMRRPLPDRSARRPWQHVAAVAAAVAMAASLALVLGLRAWAHHGAVAAKAPADTALAPPADTDREFASRVRLASGVEIAADPRTRMELPGPDVAPGPREEVVLASGRIHVQVPRLAQGRSFAVRTPDALITVHGTAFLVEVTDADGASPAATKVIVTRGVVTVQHADRDVVLTAGGVWSSREASAEPPSAPGAGTARVVDRKRARPIAATPDAGVSRPASADTDLAEQNRLFADAMSVEERGDRAEAVRRLDDFIRRYPSSLLAQDAHVERFRALAQMGDRAGAAREARLYLTLYRDGFARDEARGLALGPTSP